jgi:hypothetical protein
MTDDGVWAAARAVRWFLPELIGADAKKIDAEIAALLAEGSGRDDVQRHLREVLERSEETSVFLEEVLGDTPEFRPPTARPRTMKDAAYKGLPGRSGVRAPKFRCPVGNDYDWWQLAGEDPVPVCSTHGCVLVRA